MQPERLREIEERVWREVGAALRDRRLALGLSQEKVALCMSSAAQVIRRREHGEPASPEFLAAWMAVLGLTEEELLQVRIQALTRARRRGRGRS